MKIFAFSDIHFRCTGSFSPYNAVVNNGLTAEANNFIHGCKFIRDKIMEVRPDIVTLLGDIFHFAETQTARTLHAVSIGLGMVTDATAELGIPRPVILPGQHDIVNQEKMINNISCLRGYGDIYTRPSQMIHKGVKFAIVPYIENENELTEELTLGCQSSDIVLAHYNAAGARYETGRVSDSTVSVSSSTPILAGDLHLPQSVRNTHYCGSLVQHRFNRPDLSGVGGGMLYDLNTNKIDRYPNTYSKHYVVVRDIEGFLTSGIEPHECVLKVITDRDAEEIAEIFKNYEYVYSLQPKMHVDDVAYEYVKLEKPVDLLRAHVRSDNPDIMDVYDEIIGDR